MNEETFPLAWPLGRTRTARRTNSRFGGHYSSVEIGRARDTLLKELRLLGAQDTVISTNLTLRLDGLLRASQGEPADPGVAVYFRYRGKRMAFACDRWRRIADNLWSIAKSIEAIRGLERWGTGEMVAAAMAGFRALPPPQRPWRMVLEYGSEVRPLLSDVERRFRERLEKEHPDRGGDPARMAELNAARDDARAELGS